jgi:hypothetical protein
LIIGTINCRPNHIDSPPVHFPKWRLRYRPYIAIARQFSLTHDQDNKSLKDIAREKNETNPSQLGDPVSLKAEAADSKPTPDDTGAKSDKDGGEKKTLKQKAEEKLKSNPSALGDPVSLKAETSDTEVTADDRGARGTSKNSGKPKI